MRALIATLSAVGLAACVGCSPTSVARRAVAEVRGASAQIHPIKPLSADTAKSASAPKIATVAPDGVGAAEFCSALRQALVRRLDELKSAGKIEGSGGPLTVKTTVRFYSAKGVGKLLGSLAFAVVRVEVTDAKGQLVGKADGLSSTKAIRTGTQDLANALAEKILDWATTGRT